MRTIFISYRREDAEGQAGRLFDDLVMNFGEELVFMDVVGIEPGSDFRRAIDEHVASCGVLLALIGKNWLDAKDETGRFRLEDSTDFVRLEIAAALKRNIPVIPVLVRGASMPRADQLPPDLADLAYRNGVELTHARWDSDIQILIKALQPCVSSIPKNFGGLKSNPKLGSENKSSTIEPNTGSSNKHNDLNGEAVHQSPWAKNFLRWMLTTSILIVLAIGGMALYTKLNEETRIYDPEQPASTSNNASSNGQPENPPADDCLPPYVWRLAVPSDHICVPESSRKRVELENQRAAERREPSGLGAYGPDTCLMGYVWREAFEGDTVCVPPERREEVRRENDAAAERVRR